MSFFSEARQLITRPFRGEITEQQARNWSARQLAEALVTVVPELRESMADIELALDDQGWLSLSGGANGLVNGEFNFRKRQQIVQKCRYLWARDPLAKQAVRLWTTYGFGNGLSYEAADDGDQKQIDAFFKAACNESFLSSAGQQRSSNRLLVDGDQFFAVFATKPVFTLRSIDSLQIDRIITDPDDDERVLCYRRKTGKLGASSPEKTLYYADWALGDDEVSDAEEAKDPDTQQPIKIERDNSNKVIKVYHAAFDPFAKWGNGLLSSNYDWTREHQRFMEARVGLQQALAKFAYKVTGKGGQGIVNAIQQKLQSSLTTSGPSGSGVERNPPPPSGATWVQNTGVDIESMPRTTGGSDAKQDGDQLKLMICAGTGIMLHYFGDPSTGNLATSTSMELPMLKNFAAYQQLWKNIYRRLFSIVLEEDPEAEPADIDIELPPIIDDDMIERGTFLQQVTTAFPEAKVPELLRPCLIAMGVENIDDVMDAIAEKKEENDQKAVALAKNPPTPALIPGQAPAPLMLNKESIDALNHFADSLKEVVAN